MKIEITLENLRAGMDAAQIPQHRRPAFEKALADWHDDIEKMVDGYFMPMDPLNGGASPCDTLLRSLEEPKKSLVMSCGYCLLHEHSLQAFLKKGVTKELWQENFPDLNWHAHDGQNGEYWLDTANGSFFGWHATILEGYIVKLGRLQFHKINCIEDFPGLGIKKGDPVINMHIPACGPMDYDACVDSIQQARKYFDEKSVDYKAFFCHSWLLNPFFRKYLPPTSNIIRFQSLGYVIPGNVSSDRDALNRVFRNYHEDPLTSTPRSTLQRALQTMMLKGESMSSAFMLIMK